MKTSEKHTPGRWILRSDMEVYFFIDSELTGQNIASVMWQYNKTSKEEHLANAERIVECVNGYSALQSENERLREALKSVVKSLNLHLYEPDTVGERVYAAIQNTLNNDAVKEVGSNEQKI